MAEGKIGFAFPFFSRVHPVPARSLRLVYKSVSWRERGEETSGLSDRTSYMGEKREKTSSEESNLTTGIFQ